MINRVKTLIKNNKKVYSLAKLVRFIQQAKMINRYDYKRYPRVLQFPITNTCNSKCKMCNVTSNLLKNEMSVEDFSRIMSDRIFSKLTSVGINGGEPFLCKNLVAFVEILANKESITSINIISNGFLTKIILEKLQDIYKICKSNKKKFHVSFSLDGYGKIHENVRGVPGCFEKTMQTIKEVKENISLYCDSFDVGCTVINENTDFLIELDTYAKLNGINMKYRLGIDNARLHNESMHDSYSIFSSIEKKQTAKEFFFMKLNESITLMDQYKYWAIFTYLDGDEHRKLGCDWRDNGITMDGEGNLYYCAVKSPYIGSVRCNNGEDIFFSDNNIMIKKDIISNECDKCIHDYYGKLYIGDVFKFIRYKISRRKWMKEYMS